MTASGRLKPVAFTRRPLAHSGRAAPSGDRRELADTEGRRFPAQQSKSQTPPSHAARTPGTQRRTRIN
jgi:hypothetical protein